MSFLRACFREGLWLSFTLRLVRFTHTETVDEKQVSA